jgi:protein gp37
LTVIGTGISWTNSTWGLATGCTKVSAGCDACYAEEIVNRLPNFRHKFEDVQLHLDRLSHIKRFQPLVDEDGGLKPHMVFVNSMSDFFHEQIADQVVHQILDVMEAWPHVIMQILTKRPVRARKLLVERYRGKGIPPHIWVGVTAEDNRVAKRLDIMRSIKERCAGGTFFVSVEPIVEATDQLDFADMDWLISGGESGPRARRMQREWLMAAVQNATRMGIPLWHKQSGHVRSHPNIDRVPHGLARPADQMRWLRDNGWEFLPHEKGGATVDKQTYRELPTAYHAIKEDLRRTRLLS